VILFKVSLVTAKFWQSENIPLPRLDQTAARHNSIQLRARRPMIVIQKLGSGLYEIDSEVKGASADESPSKGGGGRRQGF
jgi:hypothetical protein